MKKVLFLDPTGASVPLVQIEIKPYLSVWAKNIVVCCGSEEAQA